ncbi:hypothetical protein PV327_010941 [Microctonus hyperodae]|uniref:peroxidase n=1 Tax=Microctonus hyperodae TaxID=165561 RepID=A0AA39FR62_MICHY|nr:hypothetical protein PV327_010941 [Microctonus hyperodae]
MTKIYSLLRIYAALLHLIPVILTNDVIPPSRVRQFDISEYVYGIDDDLQARARVAIEAEQYAYSINAWQEKTTNQTAATCEDTWESPCPPSKYRTPSGGCNNIRHPSWGARGSPYLQFLKPAYADGILQPRSSVGRHALLSPTDVIAKLELSSLPNGLQQERKALTRLTGIWAQLVLRDIASTIVPNIDISRCCQTDHQPNHKECFPSYSNDGKCRPYMRTVPTRNAYACKFVNRQQMNGASSYLDGSDIYGATDSQMYHLRSHIGGQVNITFCKICNGINVSALGYLYTIILNEHNRIANHLNQINQHWDDTKLFLEARRAVVAQIQHITLKEFAPSVLGEVLASKIHQYDTQSSSNPQHQYSSTNKPGTFDAVALAVLPVLTSLAQPSSSGYHKNESDNVNNHNADIVAYHGTPLNLDISRLDLPSINSDTWNYSAFLIHTARDHGIPGYKAHFEYCTNISVDFNVTNFIKLQNTLLLKNIYSYYDDIDLIIGGLLETPNAGAVFGPTFSCILMRQFTIIRNSDRFWYENDLPPSSFTKNQLEAIKQVTIAGLLCANSDIHTIQPMAFIPSDAYLNAKIDCARHQTLDLTAWTENINDSNDSENYNENVMNVNQQSNYDGTSKKIFRDTLSHRKAYHVLNKNPSIDDDEESIINIGIITSAVAKAKNDLMKRKQLEYHSWLERRIADPKSPAGTAASFSKANKDALILANASIFYELATNEILNGPQGLLRRRKRQVFENSDNVLGFPNSGDLSDILHNVDLSNFLSNTKAATNHEEVDCPPEDGICDPTNPYRTFTGHCNNLRNPTLAKSLTTFARLLPPVYDDGVSKPRMRSVTGGMLPNPRLISTTIHPDISNLHNRYTLMVMQFAQFVDHDLTMTPIHKGFAESIPSCRSCDSARTVHPECNPFPIPPGDHFYPAINETTGEPLCIPSMRSLPGQQHLGPREQVNQNTGFLDASVVYGENICIANILRGFSGRMNITVHPTRAKDLLPQSATLSECKSPSGLCFIGGDGRASEQPGLTVMHTMWVREHNRIMDGLRRVNPHWDAEKLYQETRRIVSAMLQHITYNEFLPRILGWNAISLYGLKLLPHGYYREYSPTCNPSILTEFASAAYRIGHSLLRPHLPRMDQNYRPVDPPILLRDGFFNTDMLYRPGMIDEMIRGLVATPMETMDQFITGEVTNHLFENLQIKHSGVDLIALNVQRARDHGIPSYNNYRALCNLKRATTFEDLSREMAPEVIMRLKRIYATVDDIDLFPGGMSERPLQGGLVGPTFGCIIAIQFRQLRKCDRFWYETDDPNIRFTETQLGEIRKNTLAKVICENMDSHIEMQRAAFDLPSNFLNPRVPCSSMAAMDFSSWREMKYGCHIGGRSVAVGESGFPTPCTSCVCSNEGTQCASLRITDCDRLLREASREAILRDDVCTAQCGFALATSEQLVRSKSLDSSSNSATTFSSTFSSTSTNSFNGFKFPDLSQFLG